MNQLADDIMWKAVSSCDNAYDGIFFYAVKTTKIFCRPSCKSRIPLQENVIYFPVFSMAMEEGFRPCKRCRPDLLEATHEESIIQATEQIMNEEFTSALTLDVLAKRVGMSKYHLQRLFKRKRGLSPLEYLVNRRMAIASDLLRNTDDSITEIAHQLGYKSSAHFTVTFRHHFDCTPTEYKNKNRGERS